MSVVYSGVVTMSCGVRCSCILLRSITIGGTCYDILRSFHSCRTTVTTGKSNNRNTRRSE